MDQIKADVLNQFLMFWETWAKRPNGVATIERLQTFFDEEITSFGTGLHEIGRDINDVIRNFTDDFTEYKKEISIQFYYSDAVALSETVCLVKAEALISVDLDDEGEVGKFHLRFSTIFKLKDERWLIQHNHVSMPASDQDHGEAYPLDALKAQNNKLQILVDEQIKLIATEKEKVERLLYNILPQKVAKELMEKGTTSPARFEEVSVLFTDFIEFTNIASIIPAKKLVKELNDIFFHFDDIVKEAGLEKIKTIGDSYMAVCGLPEEDEDHALKCVNAAQEMLKYLKQRNESSGIKWKIRLGIHSGPVVAGVVGKQKFTYDLWGDTVNMASRMESSCEENKINISAYTYDLVRDQYPCNYRGKIEVKGKGAMDMYYVN